MDGDRPAAVRQDVQVRLLGPVEVRVGGEARDLAGPKLRTVLALLALRAGALVTVDDMANAVWGDAAPQGAAATLRAYLSRLRTAALGTRIVHESGGYRLATVGLDCDVARFRELVTRARAADHEGATAAALDLLADALGLWRGVALAGTARTEWMRAEAARLEEQRLDAAELRATLLLRGGVLDVAVQELRDVSRTAPFRESLVALLMVALYRRGGQADALGVYAGLHRRMIDELGVEPGAPLRRLHAAILAHDTSVLGVTGDSAAAAAPDPSVDARSAGFSVSDGNLPVPLTSLVGRTREISLVHELLRESRLLTLTGAGGCGKTRLAIEAARRLPQRDLDGPWLVELAGLSESELLAPSLAQVLGVATHTSGPVADAIVAAVSDRPVLLVLDNCEHLLDDLAALCALLLQRCPRLQLLATSREPLGVPGERILIVPSLALRADGEELPDAVRLLVERARDVAADFTVNQANRADVERICRELDGIPLAIELAAGRLAALSVQDLAALLDDRFALLEGSDRTVLPRHRTLVAAVEWSYRLLDDDERALFAAACTFRGGFTLEALTRVAGKGVTGARTASLVASLVGKSMMVAGGGDTKRYHLLQTLREYGLRQLRAEDRHPLQDRHAQWAADLAEAADAGLRGPDEGRWAERLALEQPNLHAAMEYSLVDGDPVVGLRIAAGTHWLWYLRGSIAEGSHWLSRALDAAAAAPAELRVTASFGSGLLRYLAGDIPGALVAGREAMALVDEAAQPDLTGYVCSLLGFLEAALGDVAAAERLVATFDRLLARDISAYTRVHIRIPLSQMARGAGDLTSAELHAEEGKDLALELGYRWAADSLAWILAKVLLDGGRPVEALRHLADALRRAAAHGDRTGMLAGLHTMAGGTPQVRAARRGATLLGAVDAIGERIGYNPLQMDPVDGARGREAVVAALPPAHFAQAYAERQAMTPAQALDLGLAMAAAFDD